MLASGFVFKFIYVYTCMPTQTFYVLYVYRNTRKPEEGVRSPETRVTSGSKPPDVVAGNWTGSLQEQ